MFVDPTSQVSFKSQPNQVSSKIVGSMPLLRWYAWCRWRCSAPAAQPTTGVATAPKEWETVPANPQVYGRDQQTCYQNHGILSCKILYVYNCSEDLGTRARTIHMFVLCLNTSPGVEGKVWGHWWGVPLYGPESVLGLHMVTILFRKYTSKRNCI